MCRKNAVEKREKKTIYFSERNNDGKKKEEREPQGKNPCKKFAFFIRTFEGLFLPFFVRQTTQKKAVRRFFHNSTMMKMMANEAFKRTERKRGRGESARGSCYKKYYLTYLKAKIIGSETAASHWPTINVDKYRISLENLPSSTSSITALIFSNLRQNFYKIMLLIYHTWQWSGDCLSRLWTGKLR